MYDHNSIPGFYLSEDEINYLNDISETLRRTPSIVQAKALVRAYRRRMDEVLGNPPRPVSSRYGQLNNYDPARFIRRPRGPLGMSPGVWVTYTEVKLTVKHEVYDNIRIHEDGTEETILFQLKPGEKFAWWPYSLDMDKAIELWAKRFEDDDEDDEPLPC